MTMATLLLHMVAQKCQVAVPLTVPSQGQPTES
eukprot:SAG31_NODE_537_length_14325_cov_19.890881_7_plen_32_part_01